MTIGTDAIYCNEYDSFSVQAGANITRGDVVTVESDGKAYPACAASGPTNKQPGMGVAEVNAKTGEWLEVKHSGKVSVTGLVPGPIYLSDTPGKIAQTAGTNPQVLGFAVNTTEWVIHPDWMIGSSGADAYFKPDSGIPETDLADAVQTKLDGNAKTADLAATTTGKGAALIGYEAVPDLVATSNLRAALVEIVSRIKALETA